ncbi:simple sugar transport system ATP-binding protein [Ruminiclostridium sufflavum DSM 19573]|uniref:Simple sugar transport system ATP-binding protein n=1 Tax=Ruminiclostridium sufflavum DSM 19573 TaxID=1121337 RepID=A0A318XPH7_9FIRM|nr:ABC transporter ATP-binding protein [Ruminiclostridium sufflavum]PYG89080.1 simple sugar transport system ATP-binding protein [Ruminiclostridium sufflavum DSM 19573]
MYAIETINLTKKFGDFVANDNISITVNKGEITAIVGENGAGKTTLMNMFFGLQRPTSGELIVDGKKVAFNSSLDAINCGLGMVHQHFKLVPSLTVYENIMLGAEITRKKSPLIDKKVEKKEVQKIIEEYKFELHADDVVENISIGAKQRVEILKMLYRNVDILIFDEPTAVLTPQEVDELLISFKELKNQGKTIILITHKLREVMEVSDQVIVIKRGRIIGSKATKDTDAKEIARMMVGREVVMNVNKEYKDSSKNKTAYSVKNISTKNNSGKKVIEDISFEIKEGEILGVAGVEGNGQSELVKVLSGLMVATEGEVYLYDKNITNKWPDELRSSGVGIVPEDRYAQGLCKDMTIYENMIAGYHSDDKVCKNGIMRRNEIEGLSDGLIEKYDIRVAEKNGNVSQLSGGNAQKIIVAREFDSNPNVLIVSQPTRGVDIGSIEFIHNKILELRNENKAILLVSSELTEIMNLSDRIIVMYKGRIAGEVDGKKATSAQLGLLMAGMAAD